MPDNDNPRKPGSGSYASKGDRGKRKRRHQEERFDAGRSEAPPTTNAQPGDAEHHPSKRFAVQGTNANAQTVSRSLGSDISSLNLAMMNAGNEVAATLLGGRSFGGIGFPSLGSLGAMIHQSSSNSPLSVPTLPPLPAILRGSNSAPQGGVPPRESLAMQQGFQNQAEVMQYLQTQHQLRMFDLLAREQRGMSSAEATQSLPSVLSQTGIYPSRSAHTNMLQQALQQQRLLSMFHGASSDSMSAPARQMQEPSQTLQNHPNIPPIQSLLGSLMPPDSATHPFLPPQALARATKSDQEDAQASPTLLLQPGDDSSLNPHQVLLRSQIEVFRASENDASTHTRGRNKPINIGQVGIRCRHCAHLPTSRRQKGSTYFPASLQGIYQAAQNMSTVHMQCGICTEMPEHIKQEFARLLVVKASSSGAGRPYWAESARNLGLVDTDTGIRFAQDVLYQDSALNRANP